MRQGTTNGTFLKVGTDKFEERVQYLWAIVQARIAQMVENPEADPIRIFIKGEPLKTKKLIEGKYRLISSVSLADQLIDAMVFGTMNDLAIENCMAIPNKAGWGPVNGGWKCVPHPSKAMMAVDKSAWDWSVCAWLLELELELRRILCKNIKGVHGQLWWALAQRRYQLLFANPVFILSSGLLLRQLTPGIMKSGCKNTIVTNSICQVILHVLVCMITGEELDVIWAMGDDTLQGVPKDIKKYLEVLGRYCHVKHYKIGNEFAGYRFYGRKIEPLYKGKHAFVLLHMNPKFGQEIANSYIINYHRSSDRDWMENFFSEMGYEVMARELRDLIYDGE